MESSAAKRSAGLRFALWFALIYGVHLLLVGYALPLDVVFGDLPLGSADYATHFQQTSTIIEAWQRFGELWAYDPDMLAGVPAGLIFDVDNKAHFWFTYALTQLGLGRAAAFNAFALTSSLLAPLSIWAAAWLLRFTRREQLFALAGGVLAWSFDSTAHFVWGGGMISFGTAAHLSVLAIALYWRMLEERRWRWWLLLLPLLPLALLTHVWAFAILVVPLLGLYLARVRGLERKAHLQVWSLAAAGLAVNAYWLFPALRYSHLIAPSTAVGQATPAYLLADWLEVLVDPVQTGFVVPHTLYRFAGLCGAGLTLWRWRRERDARFWVGALTLGGLLFLTYFAALVPRLRQTEPYRFAVPLAFCAVLWGSPWWASVLRRETLHELPRWGQALVVILLVLVVPRVAQQTLYFIPELAPEFDPLPLTRHHLKVSLHAGNPAVAASGRMKAVDGVTMQLARFVREHCREPGRVLVQRWDLGETLRWATDRPIIGGFPDRRLIHEAAYLFRRPKGPRYETEAFGRYLVRYNVRYLVMSDPFPTLERLRRFLQPIKLVGHHRVYRVRHRAGYIARGQGEVHASLNRIEVARARPAPGTQAMLLRFHWLETLRCHPHCRLRREPIPHDQAGFITVIGEPSLPSKFVIEQRYP